MKLLITLLALTLVTACASKKTAETNLAKTETPATMAAAQPAKTETKKEEKHSAKKSKAPAAPTAQAAVGGAEVICKSGADERKLSIQVKDAGCELQYTKAGAAKMIASQIKGSEKCEEVMTQVKEKLVASNFTCQ
jgi:hypothetical protein